MTSSAMSRIVLKMFSVSRKYGTGPSRARNCCSTRLLEHKMSKDYQWIQNGWPFRLLTGVLRLSCIWIAPLSFLPLAVVPFVIRESNGGCSGQLHSLRHETIWNFRNAKPLRLENSDNTVSEKFQNVASGTLFYCNFVLISRICHTTQCNKMQWKTAPTSTCVPLSLPSKKTGILSKCDCVPLLIRHCHNFLMCLPEYLDDIVAYSLKASNSKMFYPL